MLQKKNKHFIRIFFLYNISKYLKIFSDIRKFAFLIDFEFHIKTIKKTISIFMKYIFQYSEFF